MDVRKLSELTEGEVTRAAADDCQRAVACGEALGRGAAEAGDGWEGLADALVGMALACNERAVAMIGHDDPEAATNLMGRMEAFTLAACAIRAFLEASE